MQCLKALQIRKRITGEKIYSMRSFILSYIYDSIVVVVDILFRYTSKVNESKLTRTESRRFGHGLFFFFFFFFFASNKYETYGLRAKNKNMGKLCMTPSGRK